MLETPFSPQQCSSSPIKYLLWSVERVVFPVPKAKSIDKKKRDPLEKETEEGKRKIQVYIIYVRREAGECY